MSVTYVFKRRQINAFLEKYPFLFARICIVQDNIVGCLASGGRVPSLLPEYMSDALYPAPKILSITFPEKAAREFEEAMEAYSLRPYKKLPKRPRPKFAVKMVLDFGYNVHEERVYDFQAKPYDKYHEDFCREVCAHAKYVYQCNFDPMPGYKY